MWERAGCPSPGRRPGEGELVTTRSNGEKVPRYSAYVPDRDFHGAAREMALMAGLGVEYVKDLPSAGELVQRRFRVPRVPSLNVTGYLRATHWSASRRRALTCSKS